MALDLEATFDVFLYSERGLENMHATEAAAWFSRLPGPVHVHVRSRRVAIEPKANGTLAWDSTFSALSRLREEEQLPPSSFMFLLTKTPNENNWFAVEDPQRLRNGFGHVDDYGWVTSAPTSVIVAHYILKGIFNALVTESGMRWDRLWHREPRGCLYDFCERKWELNLKLRTADICGDCMEVFRSIGIPDGLLEQTVSIMEASRRLALNTKQYLKDEPIFREWPFPVAITRHKAVQATNPLLRFLLLLDHFDCLVRYFYLAHEIWLGHMPELIEKPTLGWWVDKLAHSLRGERHFREVVTIAEQEGIVALRNDRRGHGWMDRHSEAYRDDANRLEQILENIEGELEPFLDKYQLVIPRQSQVKEGNIVVTFDRLVGSHILYPQFQVRFATGPRAYGLTNENEVYLAERSNREFKRMSPFIVSAVCPTCRYERLLLTDGVHQYIDVLVGHRVHLE